MSDKPYYYMDNAFWERDDKSLIKCIRITKLPTGQEKKDILSVPRERTNGTLNPQYDEVIEALTMEGIDKSHQERLTRKDMEKQQAQVIDTQNRKADQLEDLFTLKLKAFEIETIKMSTNRHLRSRLRRAQNEIELNAISTLLIGEELGYFSKVEKEDD